MPTACDESVKDHRHRQQEQGADCERDGEHPRDDQTPILLRQDRRIPGEQVRADHRAQERCDADQQRQQHDHDGAVHRAERDQHCEQREVQAARLGDSGEQDGQAAQVAIGPIEQPRHHQLRHPAGERQDAEQDGQERRHADRQRKGMTTSNPASTPTTPWHSAR